ncbi:hypothetical protein [Streptomyces jumonjinensis]|uniref:hypothetical protein n=1 Tax=Streptomyces jumonjinensis TaxID=1945 RepID=UPI00379E66CE
MKKTGFNADELRHDKSTWERRITHRSEVLKEARESGDPEYVEKAAARLDNALDGYIRDHG